MFVRLHIRPHLLALCTVAYIAGLPCNWPAFGEDLSTAKPKDERFVQISNQAMGTEFTFLFYPPNSEMQSEEVAHVAEQAFAAIGQLEQRISTWIPESQTSKVNREAAQGPVRIGGELLQVLLGARTMWEETGGVFDVTVGPLLDLWGFYRKEGHLPDIPELEAALKKVGMDKVVLDENAQTVKFAVEGMRLDFGGIGKGLALDWAAYALKEQGVSSALLDSGTSTVVVLGSPPGESGWTVRIRSPYNKSSEEYLDEVVIKDESLSTSSGSEKFFELEGKKYAHIIDPRTGRPAEGMMSATAIAPTGMESDALSTAFFVMGPERVRSYCQKHPGVRAILVLDRPDGPSVVRIGF